MDSECNHSTISINFDMGALTLYGDLSEIDLGHTENWNIVYRCQSDYCLPQDHQDEELSTQCHHPNAQAV
jgi:hypothetical protein